MHNAIDELAMIFGGEMDQHILLRSVRDRARCVCFCWFMFPECRLCSRFVAMSDAPRSNEGRRA